MSFNPFNKPLGDNLVLEDLQKLIVNKVAEGYFIEYKSDFRPPEKIAKSIASFANTYGGWYFIGVKTDGHNVANEICGFSSVAHHDPIAKVRDAIKAYIDPIPVFFAQAINIEDQKAVLVVYIPSNQETPFIHRDGRIYRRVHDSSDPTPETSRHTLDRLFDHGKGVAKEFERFCQDERVFSKSEEGIGWVKLYLSPYPRGIIEKKDVHSECNMEKLLKLSQTPLKIPFSTGKDEYANVTGNLPLNMGQTTYNSIILRQIKPAKTAFSSITVELFLDGRAKFFIPLQHITNMAEQILFHGSELVKTPAVQEWFREMYAIDEENDLKHLRFLDVRQLWHCIAWFTSYYNEWLGETNLIYDLQVSMKVENVWRSVPFYDSDEWINHVRKFGIPTVNSKHGSIPPDNRGLFMNLADACPLWIRICSTLGLFFGLPLETNVKALVKSFSNLPASGEIRDSTLQSELLTIR